MDEEKELDGATIGEFRHGLISLVVFIDEGKKELVTCNGNDSVMFLRDLTLT